MDEREPLLNTSYITYLWVIGVSLWGGVVSYFDKTDKFSTYKLIAHLSSSSFAGMMTFLLCQEVGMSGPLTGVFCGIAAHMGTPALIALIMKMRVVRNFFGEPAKDKEEEKPN